MRERDSAMQSGSRLDCRSAGVRPTSRVMRRGTGAGMTENPGCIERRVTFTCQPRRSRCERDRRYLLTFAINATSGCEWPRRAQHRLVTIITGCIPRAHARAASQSPIFSARGLMLQRVRRFPVIERILVPTDMTSFSELALRYALLFSKRLGSKLTLLHA